MKKNEIINKIISDLLDQRRLIINELKDINHNEQSFNEKRMTLDKALMDIDMKIDLHIKDCEIETDEECLDKERPYFASVDLIPIKRVFDYKAQKYVNGQKSKK